MLELDVVRERMRDGPVIPAHPLALDPRRQFDRRRQAALSRYYLDAGASGLAVGVHTTQFAIRETGLYRPVLECAAATVDGWTDAPVTLIAGLCGPTAQALAEADVALGCGYHAGLLSLAGHGGASEDELIAHCRTVAEAIPVVGFYLQPAVGGIHLSAGFWRRFAEIERVVAIKIAPFNRYRTLDVVRGVAEAGAEDRIALLTGNDDHIVLDLLARYRFRRGDGEVELRIAGGLLGHWCVWTRASAATARRAMAATGDAPAGLVALDAAVTDMNAAIFDAANDFRGCIAGCHEVLRRQGLLESVTLIDPDECLSPGQAAEIDRVTEAYPELIDDAFVAANLERWLA